MHTILARALDVLESAVRGKSDAQLMARPAGKWSAAEVIEHLAITYESTVKAMERAIAYGPSADTPTLKQRVYILYVVDLGRFPEGRGAPEFTIPTGVAPAEALRRMRVGMETMDLAITRCEEQFGKNAYIAAHPILGPMNAARWRKFHLVHAEHHAKQIRERAA